MLERSQGLEEVGAVAVEHVDEDEPGSVKLGGARPQPARGHLDSGYGVDDEDGGLANTQSGERVGDEARLAGRVQQVDLVLAPGGGAESQRNRHLTRLLLGV